MNYDGLSPEECERWQAAQLRFIERSRTKPKTLAFAWVGDDAIPHYTWTDDPIICVWPHGRPTYVECAPLYADFCGLFEGRVFPVQSEV